MMIREKIIRLAALWAILLWAIFGLAQIPARAAGDWKKSETANFRVVGSASEKSIERIAARLEDFRRAFFRLFALPETASPIPTNVLVFASDDDFNFYLNSNLPIGAKRLTANSFQPGRDANYIVVSSADGEGEEGARETDLRRAFHDYFHYLLSNHVGKRQIPAWLNEGLAKVYENHRPRADRQANLSFAGGNDLELLRSNKLLPAEVFYGVDYYSLNQQENHHRSSVFAAQTHFAARYLLTRNDEKDFARFINLLAQETAPHEALARAFRMDAATVEKNLKLFIEQELAAGERAGEQTMTGQSSPPTPNLAFSNISAAEAEAFFGDYLYQAGRYDEAERRALKSLALDAERSAFALSTLGAAKLGQFKLSEALPILEKSRAAPGANYLNHYRYAYALSRRGMTEHYFVSVYDAETAEKIRESAKKAAALNPAFAESYNLLALVSFVRNDEIDEALKFIGSALQIAPGNDWFLLRKAELEMRRENFAEARKNAWAVYRHAESGGLRLYAQNTVQRIDSTEFQLLAARRNASYPYSDAISEVPFSDEEIARLRRKALLESITRALRRPAPGERRILGSVANVECRENQLLFTIKTASGIVKLRADSFESLNLTTFSDAQTRASVGCGAFDRENAAIVIYRQNADFALGTAGEILSIEFVPQEFTLAEKD